METSISAAVAAIAAGQPVVVVNDPGDNDGDLVFAATAATPALLAFAVRHTSGFVCVALPDELCNRLDLAPMYGHNGGQKRPAYQVTVDLRGGGTGISARDRATTIAALGSPGSVASDFKRPGHVVPLRALPGGVLERPGHAEAAVDLARLAGCTPAGALCKIVSADQPNGMAHGAELDRFAKEHDLVRVSVADIVAHCRRTETSVRQVVRTVLPTKHGVFTAIGYSDSTGAEHVVLVAGDVDRVNANTPRHIHVECLTGDVLRSTSCNCGSDVDAAMGRFGAAGRGVLVYLRPAGPARACGLRERAAESASDPIADSILADLAASAIAAPNRRHSSVPGPLQHGRSRSGVLDRICASH